MFSQETPFLISRLLFLPEVLDLDFSGCELKHLAGSSMTSPSSPSSGSCLPNMTSLHTLKLDVTGCQHLSDIQVLSDDMQSLRILHLRLSQTALTSLENLVKPLEQITISDFELNVAYCSSLTNLGSLSSGASVWSTGTCTFEFLRLCIARGGAGGFAKVFGRDQSW